ncbi:hypothetical protein ONZ43_g7738 [Nemania bipapillata]|uniref:Uncharacterized protein n=1 Tax=Nemania bipapillata TaxID=110536 RepID=A0ACC2HPA7_9PEZI|nr:hypothetical protein ONZ43_g7738 [Nemania bipapillata]
MTDTPVTGTSTPGALGKKKRGRPSKAEVHALHIAQQASFGEEELANVPLPPASTNGPSLSTPKKRLARVVADMDDPETDINEAISKQLRGGSESDSDDRVARSEEEALDESDKLDMDVGFTSLDSFLPGPSSRGYAEFSVPTLPSSTQPDPSRFISPVPISLPPTSKSKPSSRRKTQLTNPVPVPPSRKPTWNKSETPIPVPSYPLPKAKLSTQPHVVTVTPIPAPPYAAAPKPKPRAESHQTKITPILPPPCPVPRPKEPHTITYTPVPAPLPFPHTPATSAAPISKNGSSHKRKQPQPEAEKEWEVKRLEGDKFVEIKGKLVRHFLVRWVGKWPAGQNPTWEPEEYIPEAMVRRYLKNKLAKMAQSGSSPSQTERLTPAFKRTYSSVAEAFEGDVDAVPLLSTSSPGGFQVDDGGDEEEGEEHLQVTEHTRSNTPFQKSRIDPGLLRELVASFS